MFKGICRKSTVTPQDTKIRSVSLAPSTKTTEVKTQDKAENTDNTIVPDDQKQTSGTVVSVETRRTRRISELLKSIEEKQALAPQDFMGPEVCGYPPSTVKDNRKEEEAGPSQVARQKPPETLERVESKGFKFRLQIDTEINQLYYREEEFVPHDEGSWEEYESCKYCFNPLLRKNINAKIGMASLSGFSLSGNQLVVSGSKSTCFHFLVCFFLIFF